MKESDDSNNKVRYDAFLSYSHKRDRQIARRRPTPGLADPPVRARLGAGSRRLGRGAGRGPGRPRALGPIRPLARISHTRHGLRRVG